MSSNIFGNDDKKNNEFYEKVDTHSKAILNVIEREKDLEASLDLLNEKIELLDHNSIKNFKEIFRNTREFRNELNNLKEDILKLTDFSEKLTKQLKLFSTKDEVIKLEKYIDLWNPMDFVTREELYYNSNNKNKLLITTKDLNKFEKKIKIEIKKELMEIVENFLKNK